MTCQAWGEGARGVRRGAARAAGRRRRRRVISARSTRSSRRPRIRVPHLRLGRTGRVLEALIPAVIEQRVPGADAFRAWRLLVTKFGTPAPGPAPARMRVPPSAEGVAADPVLGVPSRQRRPRPRPHDRRMRAARGRAGAVVGPSRRRGARSPHQPVRVSESGRRPKWLRGPSATPMHSRSAIIT